MTIDQIADVVHANKISSQRRGDGRLNVGKLPNTDIVHNSNSRVRREGEDRSLIVLTSIGLSCLSGALRSETGGT